ncbi:RNA 3'-terminal phosphate cyclase [Mariniblastus sp.]|nr:RNA 3'-terminal phosphate cyclase [Mariniblastus sp.]
MIEIDGAQGEGGGQIIRSSLALSAVTGKPFTIKNIRAGRKKSGLKRQHVTCVNAAREVCGGAAVGAELNSSELTFIPGPIQTRAFDFKIGTAGSTTLVAQTVLPALMLAENPSSVTVEGGTHNPGGPPFDFLDRVYLPQIEKMGPSVKAKIERHGFYPAGGGKIKVDVQPSGPLLGLNLVERRQKIKAKLMALVSNLPLHIAERELDVIRRKGKWHESQCYPIEIKDSLGPGNVVMLEFDSGNVNEIITGYGKPGVPAENIARKTYRDAKPYLTGDYPVGEHLADQLLLPMGLAAAQTDGAAESEFVTGPLSLHATTHIDILKRFLDIEVIVEEVKSGVFRVRVTPV